MCPAVRRHFWLWGCFPPHGWAIRTRIWNGGVKFRCVADYTIAHRMETEPEDFHRREQGLSLTADSHPTTCLNIFVSSSLLHTCMILRDFLFGRDIVGLEPTSPSSVDGMLPLHHHSNLCRPFPRVYGSLRKGCTSRLTWRGFILTTRFLAFSLFILVIMIYEVGLLSTSLIY